MQAIIIHKFVVWLSLNVEIFKKENQKSVKNHRTPTFAHIFLMSNTESLQDYKNRYPRL